MRATIPCLALVLTACAGSGSDDDDVIDPPINPCWRGEDEVVEAGSIEVGTGFHDFEKLVAEQSLQVETGAQGLHHFMVNVRMWGMDPGDLSYSAEENPQTRLTAYFDDGSRVDDLDCSYSIFYVARSDGDGYELYSGRPLIVADGLLDVIGGKRIRIVAEVVDAERRYARDETWVVAIGPDSPDRGAPDLFVDEPRSVEDVARAVQ